jgi:hypothetical protein
VGEENPRSKASCTAIVTSLIVRNPPRTDRISALFRRRTGSIVRDPAPVFQAFRSAQGNRRIGFLESGVVPCTQSHVSGLSISSPGVKFYYLKIHRQPACLPSGCVVEDPSGYRQINNLLTTLIPSPRQFQFTLLRLAVSGDGLRTVSCNFRQPVQPVY